MSNLMNEPGQNELLCEFWEQELIVLKRPSRLYHLEPIGIGTPFVESLTSYVTRLAEAHCVYPRVLMLEEIIPFLSQPLWRVKGNLTDVRLAHHCLFSSMLNGTTGSASDLVQALEQLTLRHDLRFLTLLPWQSILPVTKLLRRERAWCPACYEDWRKSNCSVYDPLLWALVGNKVCLNHRLPLQTNCPASNCGRSMPPLSQRAQPGHCVYCQTWLGGPWQYQEQKPGIPEEEVWHQQQWVVNTLGEWLATAPTRSVATSREQVITTIARYAEIFTQGNKEAFSRRIHVPQSRVPQWLNAASLPTLENLLQLCFHTGVSLVDFLDSKVPIPAISGPKESEEKPGAQQRRKPKPFDASKVKDAMEAALQDVEGPPISFRKLAKSLEYDRTTIKAHFPALALAFKNKYREAINQRVLQRGQRKLERATRWKAKKPNHDTIRATLEATLQTTEVAPLPLEKIAQQLGCAPAYLRKYFPDHCHSLVSRHKDYMSEKSRLHLQQICNEVQEKVLETHKKGLYPSFEQVGKMLKNPGVFRDPQVRRAMLETKRALGYIS